jgi:hypothetical protein
VRCEIRIQRTLTAQSFGRISPERVAPEVEVERRRVLPGPKVSLVQKVKLEGGGVPRGVGHYLDQPTLLLERGTPAGDR